MNKAAACTIGAITLFSACSNAHLRTNAATECPVRMAAGPRPAGKGTITRLLLQGEAMALLSRTQVIVGRPIDSAYVNNIRAVIRISDGTMKTVLLPYNMTADVGDRIAFQSSYLSSPPLCNYVPALATRKL